MLSLRVSSRSSPILKPLLACRRKPELISPRNLSRSSPRRNLYFSLKPSERNGLASTSSTSETYVLDDTPLSGINPLLSLIYMNVCNQSFKLLESYVTRIILLFPTFSQKPNPTVVVVGWTSCLNSKFYSVLMDFSMKICFFKSVTDCKVAC